MFFCEKMTSWSRTLIRCISGIHLNISHLPLGVRAPAPQVGNHWARSKQRWAICRLVVYQAHKMKGESIVISDQKFSPVRKNF